METNKKQPLELHLEIPKQSFSARDKISVVLALRNQSSFTVTVNKRMSINPSHMPEKLWEVWFDITYPPGKRKTRVSQINTRPPEQKHFINLSPGEEIRRAYTLTDWYWMQLQGTYEVKAVYHNLVDGSEFGLIAWTGEITSNSVSFKVN